MPGSESDYQQRVFCGASTTANGAVVFLRQKVVDCIETQLLTAKTRVAPIVSVYVPRLELCAALLDAKLFEAVSAAINDELFPKPKIFCLVGFSRYNSLATRLSKEVKNICCKLRS